MVGRVAGRDRRDSRRRVARAAWHEPGWWRRPGPARGSGQRVLLAVGTAAFTVGARYGNPGIVATLSNSNALVATVLGTVLYRERLTRREQACAAVLLLGVALITAG